MALHIHRREFIFVLGAPQPSGRLGRPRKANVASAIVSAYDRPGDLFSGVKSSVPDGEEAQRMPTKLLKNFHTSELT
jgi:hypothetical protein